jgi:hypothetical protein
MQITDTSNRTITFAQFIKGVPIRRYNDLAVAVTADANFFSTGISVTYTPSDFTFYIVPNSAGKLTVVRTKTGKPDSLEIMNNNADLIAGTAYLFTVPVDDSETINLRYSVNDTIRYISIRQAIG